MLFAPSPSDMELCSQHHHPTFSPHPLREGQWFWNSSPGAQVTGSGLGTLSSQYLALELREGRASPPPWASSRGPGLPQLPGCQREDKAHTWGGQSWATSEKWSQALTEPRKPPPSLWVPHPA